MKKAFLYDLIAAQPTPDSKYHGGGKYAKKVFSELAKHQANDKWELYALFDSSLELDSEIEKELKDYSVKLIDIKGKNIQDVIIENNIDRFYTALPFSLTHYGFFSDNINLSKCEIYSTMHGLRSLEMPIPYNALYYATSFKEKLSLIAKILLAKYLYRRDKKRFLEQIKKTKIVAVSNHTKFSVLAFYNEVKEDIRVFYSPDVSHTIENADENEKIERISDDYFLLVSGNRWLKNNLRSAIALDELFTERKEIKHSVIITGVSDPSIYLRRIKNPDRFKFYSYVSEVQLRNLYENAYAMLYMSLNEGFGYPPLEAMKFGVPVITSPFTSIIEVCGSAALYSNPYSEAEIKARILQMIDGDTRYNLSIEAKDRFAIIQKRQILDLDLLVDYLLD